jgi:26S proteasome regulatory subunit N9
MDVDSSFLSSAAASAPASLAPYYRRFGELHAKKLWYQLTLAVEEFLAHPDSAEPPRRIDVFEHFVKGFKDKINQLRLVGMAVRAARQLQGEWQCATMCCAMRRARQCAP